MNFLLGATLLVLLILPGLLFRIGYISEPYYNKTFRSGFQEELLFAIAPAFILHSLNTMNNL